MKVFSKLRLRGKMLTYFLLANLLVFLPGLHGLSTIISNSTEKIYNDARYNFREAQLQFSNKLDSSFMVLDNILMDQFFLRQLNKKYVSVADYFSSYFEVIRDTVSKQNILLPQNMRIEVYGDNPTIVYDGWLLSRMSEQVCNEPWAQRMLEANGAMTLCVSSYGADTDKVLIQGRSLKERYGKYAFITMIRIPFAVMQDLYKQTKLLGDVYLLAEDNTILYSSAEDSIGMDFASAYPDIASLKSNGGTLHGLKSGIVLEGNLSANNSTRKLRLFNVIDNTLLSGDGQVVWWSIYLFIAGIIASMLVIILFVNQICSRIYQLTDGLTRVKSGDYHVQIRIKGKDELADLCRDFNLMTKEIDILVNEQHVYELRLQEYAYKRKEAELMTLQSQINPHFLVNFMEAVRAQLIKEGSLATSQVLLSYTKFLRRSIDWAVDRVTIAAELKAICEYLEIQVFRYKDKITYDVFCDNGAEEIVIPKFLIQPLVENAIHHGVEKIIGPGKIKVRVSQADEENLEVTVEDNGAGIEAGRLKMLQTQLDAPELETVGTNIGLLNVANRIRLFYGPQFRLEIQSEAGKGTCVRMHLPKELPERSARNALC